MSTDDHDKVSVTTFNLFQNMIAEKLENMSKNLEKLTGMLCDSDNGLGVVAEIHVLKKDVAGLKASKEKTERRAWQVLMKLAPIIGTALGAGGIGYGLLK